LSDFRSFAALLQVALVTTVAVASLARARAAERLVEGIAAQVGNEIVLASEVMELAGPVEERMRQAGAPASEIVMVRKDALERLIENRLLSSVVERLELSADREEVDAAIAAIAEDNELTIEQLLTSIASHGLSVEEYRSKIRGELERTKVVNAMVRSRVQISDEEVRALYDERFGKQRSGGEEIHIRHILVTSEGPKASSNEMACQIVAEARAQIESSEVEFVEIARRVSDLNPETGGDLGWMHREDLAGWMSDTIRELNPGELSSVIEMPFGCNLLQVVDRREFRRIEYEEAKLRLQNVVYQSKTEIEYVKWLEVLRAQTYIERKAGFGG
jgi:peptidyl-prolyl cis-trans isomerase SurA